MTDKPETPSEAIERVLDDMCRGMPLLAGQNREALRDALLTALRPHLSGDAGAMLSSPGHDKASFNQGVRAAVAWLHAEARTMNDPHARSILNNAGFHLGQSNSRQAVAQAMPDVEGMREALVRLSNDEGNRITGGSPGPLYTAGWNGCAKYVADIATNALAATPPSATESTDDELRMVREGPVARATRRAGVASGDVPGETDLRSAEIKSEKRCFTYCGDKCDCGAGATDFFAIPPYSQADGDARNAHLKKAPSATGGETGDPDVEYAMGRFYRRLAEVREERSPTPQPGEVEAVARDIRDVFFDEIGPTYRREIVAAVIAALDAFRARGGAE